ncbi:MAG: dephospho-CoA kinase [Saccharospirillaceae bacterium]|nr:dephospho-CoA kinase [Pseudomonadales bacterium]NRB78207.1 dephospho-CoA kinase [Saccharospirillaceae bacterium]
MIIGLTGGIASGKTTASNFLKSLNIPIIDADVIAREITQANHPILLELANTFGLSILNNGELNRQKLRQIAFSSPEQLKKLNAITHPAIRTLIIERLKNTITESYTVLSAPLLFENELHNLCDETWLIDVAEPIQLKRIIRRDNSNVLSAQKIIDAQLDPKIKRDLADIIIDNSKDINHLKQCILKQHHLTLEKIQ